jgi:RNA polymerase sigma factor for flagellar operon FliA
VPPTRYPDVDSSVWRAFLLERTGPARERIFEAYLPFSRRVAARVRRERAGADLDMDDLRQYAAEGLLQAIDRFDPDRGKAFEAFAARRIAGSVIDGIGAHSESRRQAAFRNRVRVERARSLRPADPDRLSAAEALQALADLAADLAIGFMLDEAAILPDIGSEAASPNAYESVAWADTVRRMAAALETLPDQERTVIRLHYLQGLEFARIADTLSLSRGRVSQIHASALQRLRTRLPKPDHLHFQR